MSLTTEYYLLHNTCLGEGFPGQHPSSLSIFIVQVDGVLIHVQKSGMISTRGGVPIDLNNR